MAIHKEWFELELAMKIIVSGWQTHTHVFNFWSQKKQKNNKKIYVHVIRVP